MVKNNFPMPLCILYELLVSKGVLVFQSSKDMQYHLNVMLFESSTNFLVWGGTCWTMFPDELNLCKDPFLIRTIARSFSHATVIWQ